MKRILYFFKWIAHRNKFRKAIQDVNKISRDSIEDTKYISRIVDQFYGDDIPKDIFKEVVLYRRLEQYQSEIIKKTEEWLLKGKSRPTLDEFIDMMEFLKERENISGEK